MHCLRGILAINILLWVNWTFQDLDAFLYLAESENWKYLLVCEVAIKRFITH